MITGQHRNGALRRAQIIAFVRQYEERNDGIGPTATQIAAAVGYRGHNLRSRHLDALVRQGRLIHSTWTEWRAVE